LLLSSSLPISSFGSACTPTPGSPPIVFTGDLDIGRSVQKNKRFFHEKLKSTPNSRSSFLDIDGSEKGLY
jgi:hypothetical protein